MRSALLALLMVGCGSDHAAKHWVLWEVADDIQIDVAGTYSVPRQRCTDSVWVLWSGRFHDTADGVTFGIPGGSPGGGQLGPVTCVGSTMFTAPPNSVQVYWSREGQPFEAMEVTEGWQAQDIRAASNGSVWRTLVAADRVLPPRVEVSRDAGITWEFFTTPTGTTDGPPDRVGLISVEAYVWYSVQNSRSAGTARINYGGDATVLSNSAFSGDYESPEVVLTGDEGLHLAATALSREGLPRYAFGGYYFTDRDPTTRAAPDWQRMMWSGPPALRAPFGPVLAGDRTMGMDWQGRLVSHSEGVFLRTVAPWEQNRRAEVLAGPGCSTLEGADRSFEGDAPGEVVLTNSGTDAVYAGEVTDDGVLWKNVPPVAGQTIDPLDPGESLSMSSDQWPVLVMDAAGRCLGVLGANDGGDVDVAGL